MDQRRTTKRYNFYSIYEFLLGFPSIESSVHFIASGSLVGQTKFAQFTGTVQVMKAVGNHMVLTFCENLPGSQLFSIVLSRRPDTLSVDVRISIVCTIDFIILIEQIYRFFFRFFTRGFITGFAKRALIT